MSQYLYQCQQGNRFLVLLESGTLDPRSEEILNISIPRNKTERKFPGFFFQFELELGDQISNPGDQDKFGPCFDVKYFELH